MFFFTTKAILFFDYFKFIYIIKHSQADIHYCNALHFVGTTKYYLNLLVGTTYYWTFPAFLETFFLFKKKNTATTTTIRTTMAATFPVVPRSSPRTKNPVGAPNVIGSLTETEYFCALTLAVSVK